MRLVDKDVRHDGWLVKGADESRALRRLTWTTLYIFQPLAGKS